MLRIKSILNGNAKVFFRNLHMKIKITRKIGEIDHILPKNI